MSKDHELSGEIDDLIVKCEGAGWDNLDPVTKSLLDIASKLNERCDRLAAELKAAAMNLGQPVARPQLPPPPHPPKGAL